MFECFYLDANELRRKLARGDEEQAEKTRQFNEEVMYVLKTCKLLNYSIYLIYFIVNLLEFVCNLFDSRINKKLYSQSQEENKFLCLITPLR